MIEESALAHFKNARVLMQYMCRDSKLTSCSAMATALWKHMGGIKALYRIVTLNLMFLDQAESLLGIACVDAFMAKLPTPNGHHTFAKVLQDWDTLAETDMLHRANRVSNGLVTSAIRVISNMSRGVIPESSTTTNHDFHTRFLARLEWFCVDRSEASPGGSSKSKTLDGFAHLYNQAALDKAFAEMEASWCHDYNDTMLPHACPSRGVIGHHVSVRCAWTACSNVKAMMKNLEETNKATLKYVELFKSFKWLLSSDHAKLLMDWTKQVFANQLGKDPTSAAAAAQRKASTPSDAPHGYCTSKGAGSSLMFFYG